MAITIEELLKDPLLSLSVAAGEQGLGRRVLTPELNRPSLELTGFFAAFRAERIQVIGNGEITFIETHRDAPELASNIGRILTPEVPCAIVTNGRSPPRLLAELAEKAGVPVLQCPHNTTKLYKRLWEHLDSEFAPEVSVHGVLMDIHDMGVLILGESKVGKSECALELIRRGFHLGADDLVAITCLNDSILMGRATALLPYHMETRGLGIIDVSRLFGVASIRPDKRVTLVITLREWEESGELDRLGLDDETREILGVAVPHVTIPIRPGRNVGTLVEVAALNQKLKGMGVHTARLMERMLLETLQREGSEPPSAPDPSKP